MPFSAAAGRPLGLDLTPSWSASPSRGIPHRPPKSHYPWPNTSCCGHIPLSIPPPPRQRRTRRPRSSPPLRRPRTINRPAGSPAPTRPFAPFWRRMPRSRTPRRGRQRHPLAGNWPEPIAPEFLGGGPSGKDNPQHVGAREPGRSATRRCHGQITWRRHRRICEILERLQPRGLTGNS